MELAAVELLKCPHGFITALSRAIVALWATCSETIAACDLKVGRCSQLIEFMKVCEY